ncbi:hypothetical protein C8T65DRAFT_712286 [Cerioporus squamosus]|nr:hypothetical protein C8T65DRAFT_712286 [Cerioporus squamosus]
MRASLAPHRHSQLPGSASSAAAAAKLAEKKKEFQAVAALERASASFVRRIEDLADDFDVMADAGIVLVHGQVLEQWPNMFRILNLFCTRLSQREDRSGEDEDASAPTTGERLVRVPVDDLRRTNPESA